MTWFGLVLIAAVVAWYLIDRHRGFPDNRSDTQRFDDFLHKRR
jgi:hypothetical protein